MAKATKTTAVPEPIAAGVTEYEVTDKAPPKVAGRRVQVGDKLTLTDDQARFEETAGHIRKAAVTAAPMSE